MSRDYQTTGLRDPRTARAQDCKSNSRGPVRWTRQLTFLVACNLVVLLARSPLRAALPFVFENAFELQSDGDFDGDGRRDLIIVDKATGAYRIGYQLSSNTITWAAARASGIAGATGLGIGKLNSTVYDSLALAGPDANRINILDATNGAAPALPASVFIPSLGPNLAAVIDIGGVGNNSYDDIYAASIYNGPPYYRETLLRNTPTNRTLIADNLIGYLRERANPVLLHTNRPPRLALFERNVSVNVDYFSIFDLSSGAAASVASVGTNQTPRPYEYVTAQFIATNPYPQFLLYPPTGSALAEYQVTEPSPGVYALPYTNTLVVTNAIDRLFVLPGTNGNRLLIFDVGGASATIYSFNGQTAPSPLQGFSASPGEHFTGAGIFGEGFQAYSAPLGQNTSSKFRQFNWNGSSYSSIFSGDLPRLNTYSAAGNVLQFQFEPFVTNNPILLRLNNAGDWSSAPAFSGSPGNISVKTETFLSSTQGLANPTLTTLGAAHPLAAFGLANQYSNMISLFSFTAPAGDKLSDVTISPQPGIYATSIQLGFSAANPTDNIYFRIAADPWNTWSNSLVVYLFTNTAVQYYSAPTNGSGKSSIKLAGYSFTTGPATLDSKGDGIPDYVKIARGLSLTGSRDSDGDGYSDLEELIHGKDPLSAASVPTNFPHLDDQAVFDVSVKPKPWDGFANAVSLVATGAMLHAYDFQGSLLSEATAGSNSWPAARLTNIVIVAEDRLLAHATDLHYSIVTTNPDKIIGREMLGLVAVPPLTLPSIPYVYGGGSLSNEAFNWIMSASNVLNNLPRAVLTNNLSISNTLESLLFEKKVAQLLAARSNAWWTNITLFPFRVSDAGRTNPPQSLLLSLESATTNQPGYKLLTLFATISNLVETSLSAPIADLRAVVQDIYRIDSLLNNTNPTAFASPVDETRYFLWNSSLESNYLAWATTAAQFASASNGAYNILAAVPSRPVTNVYLTVRPDTLGASCHILDLYGGGATFALQDANGLPFAFPNNFQLIPGAIVGVSGYTDVTNSSCLYPAIQVGSAVLSGVPVASDSDGDGNLLVDSWEKRFYGMLGLANPFADSDGDGYQNLQEMLEGSDPRDIYGVPAVGSVTFAPPVLNLVESGGLIELHFNWPAIYIGKFNFGVRHASDLNVPFSTLAVSGPVHVFGDEFKMVFLPPGTPQHYYYLTVALH